MPLSVARARPALIRTGGGTPRHGASRKWHPAGRRPASSPRLLHRHARRAWGEGPANGGGGRQPGGRAPVAFTYLADHDRGGRPRQGPRAVATGGAAQSSRSDNRRGTRGSVTGINLPRMGGGSAGRLMRRSCRRTIPPPRRGGLLVPRRFHGFRGGRRSATSPPLHPWLQPAAPAGAVRKPSLGRADRVTVPAAAPPGCRRRRSGRRRASSRPSAARRAAGRRGRRPAARSACRPARPATPSRPAGP